MLGMMFHHHVIPSPENSGDFNLGQLVFLTLRQDIVKRRIYLPDGNNCLFSSIGTVLTDAGCIHLSICFILKQAPYQI